MTVYIEKPAVNLREELASLRNQGGYEEQRFYFDGLVTNGTFDADISGWTNYSTGSASVAWNASGYIDLTGAADGRGQVYQAITTVIGSSYSLKVQVTDATPYQIHIGTSAGGNQLHSGTDSTGNKTVTFTATTTTSYVALRSRQVAETVSLDNVSVFETDGTDVVHKMPKGWKPKDVFEDGLLQREGAAYDYEVVYDGFDYYVKPAVAPSATTQTCVIGVKA
jgi:hypothetical protein